MSDNFNTSTETHSNTIRIRGKLWFPLGIFLVGNTIIALIYLSLVRSYNYAFIKNGEPTFALPPNGILWTTFVMLILIGLSNFFIHNLKTKPSKSLNLDFILYYVHILLFLMFALFTYTLKMPVAGLIFLMVTIGLLIFVSYRYLCRTIVGGAILTIWTLWLMYVLSLLFAFVLL